jgi:hypothetical protein
MLKGGEKFVSGTAAQKALALCLALLVSTSLQRLQHTQQPS